MRKFFAILLVLLIVGAVYTLFLGRGNQSSLEFPELSLPGFLGGEYTNEQYGFSFVVPKGYVVRALAPDSLGRDAILVEKENGEGIQILMTLFDEPLSSLTSERIRKDVPDMRIEEPERVDIGAGHTGLAFKSDNPEFDSASREVWFVFRGTLYQISTYERLDSDLRQLFATWTFF